MARCGACGSTVLFGGASIGEAKFCNAKCAQRGQMLTVSRQLPPDLVRTKVSEVYRGSCPKCKGPGPVDLHNSYRVFSVLLATQWQTRPHISCRSCGTKSQAGDLLFSLFAGWWGFPWGLIMTPVQIARNIGGMIKSAGTEPSPELENAVRISLASAAVSSKR
jgi:hypothetical protein